MGDDEVVLAGSAGVPDPDLPVRVCLAPCDLPRGYERLEMYRADVIIPFGLTSMVIQALLFAWAYPRLFSTARDWLARGALGFAAVFGTLAWSFAVLPVAAKYRMTFLTGFLALETAFTVVQLPS
jgi:hypothetical protein